MNTVTKYKDEDGINVDLLISDADNNEKMIFAYLAEVKHLHNRADTTVDTYKRVLNLYNKYLDGIRFETTKAVNVRAFVNSVKKNNVSPLTINNYIVSIKLFYQFLEDNEFIEKNPAKRIGKEPVEEKIYKEVVNQEQVKRVYTVLKSRLEMKNRNRLTSLRNIALFDLLLKTGIRVMSAQRADIGDLKFKNNRGVLEYKSKGLATKKDAILEYNTIQYINDYLAHREDNNQDAPLFANHNRGGKSTRLSKRSIREMIRKVFIDAGITTESVKNVYCAHSLRHTFGTTITMLLGEAKAQTEMGHKTNQPTRKYTKKIREIQRYDNRPDLDKIWEG